MNRIKKYCILLSATLLVSGFGVTGSVAATLTDSTSLTIVHVTSYLNSRTPASITTWKGAWPNSYLVSPEKVTYPPVSGTERLVYLTASMTAHNLGWTTIPSYTPYPRFPNGLNSMICNVYSFDKGKTFELGSWDYLAPTSSGKGLEEGMPDCWIGTMVHSYCEFEGGLCNGRYKSNLYFSEYPATATNCWGSAMKN